MAQNLVAAATGLRPTMSATLRPSWQAFGRKPAVESARQMHTALPTARNPVIKSRIAQHSSMFRNGPLSQLRQQPRFGMVGLGLGLAQQRSLFGGPSREQLARLEEAANNNPNSATSQASFYSAVMRASMPQIVIDRYNTGQFATNAVSDRLYRQALEKTGQSAAIGNTQEGNNGLTPQQIQAVSQAVGANMGAGQIGKARGGVGVKSDPVYVVVEESLWNVIFKWVRWFAGFALAAYVSLILITLFVETSGILKKVGGGTSAEVRPEHQNTRFSDVHGCDEAKEELLDVVDFLKHPERYNKLGGRPC